MANFIDNWKRKQKRKKIKARKAKLAKARAAGEEPVKYEDKLRRHRTRRMTQIGIAAAVIVVAVLLISLYIEKRTYHNYRVISTSKQEDIVSTRYTEMGDNILRYSQDGVTLETKEMETIWSETYSMQNPVADVRGDYAVIADKDGTTMEMFNKKGYTGSVTTSYTIVKATVSSKGLVAAVLDGGDDTWINFYGTDGSLIAENQTKIDDPGYPMDVAISNNGVLMMVAYQFVDGSQTTSYVAFYNFGDVGQDEDDRIVSGYTYDGIVVPQIEYLDGDHCVAIREDGFTIYGGTQIPKELKTVQVEQEIVSTFYDENNIGLVFKNESKDKLYTMEVYSTSGKLKFKKEFNIPYTNIRMSNGSILMYNSSQVCVMNSRGVTKFSGTIDGTIEDFFKLGWNRYLLVLDNGVNVVKFA